MSGTIHWKARWQQSPLAQRWQSLPARERLALSVLAVFLSLVLLYLLAWRPVLERFERAKAHYQQQQELHAYIQANVGQARQAQKGAKLQVASEQLQGLATSSAQQQGLVLERLDNDGTAGLVISLSQVPFESLLRWLSELQKKGVSLSEVSLDRAGAGKVNARVTLQATAE